MVEPSEHSVGLIYRIAQTFNSSLDFQSVLEHVMDEVNAATFADCSFLVLSDANGAKTVHGMHGMDSCAFDAPEYEVSRALIERVIAEGRPQLINGPPAFANAGGSSILCVPLLVKDVSLGAIYLQRNARAGIFTPQDRDLLMMIAALASIAIENARLYRDAARSADELRRLYDTSLDITRQLDRDQLLELIIQRAANLLAGESGNFYFYNDRTDELVPDVLFGRHVSEPPYNMLPGEGASGRVLLTGEPLIVQDYDTWEGRSSRIPPGRYARILHVPVRRGTDVIGTLSVNRAKTAPPFTQEDMQLLLMFANQAAIAIENARLFQVSADKARMEQELQVARDVQSSLLPRRLPKRGGWEFDAFWQPASIVSGDFYDFIPLSFQSVRNLQGVGLAGAAAPAPARDAGLGIAIGDVAGKGIGAAVFMASVRSILHAMVASAPSPAEAIARSNRLICQDATGGMFVSLNYAQLDPASGRLRCVNAGHPPALLYRSRDDQLVTVKPAGKVLGFRTDGAYTEQHVELGRGDWIFFYTDGIPEASSREDQFFSEERLHGVLLENRRAPAHEIVAAVTKSLADFLDSASPPDDVTMVIAKRVD